MVRSNEPGAANAIEEVPLSPCLNCGHPLNGPFCSQCGQEAMPPVPRLGDLVREVLDEFLKLDSKVLNSLKTLVTRPGQLTAEYAAGRRASYVAPFKLYFWSSFLFYVLMSLSGDQNAGSWGINKSRMSPTLAKGLESGFEFFMSNAATISILLLPLNALALALLFRGRKQHFLLHLVATLHIWSGSVLLYLPFYFIVEVIIHLHPTVAMKAMLGPSYMLFIFAYQVVAFRRLFRASIVEAVLKSAAVSVWTAFISSIVALVIMVGFVVKEVVAEKSAKPAPPSASTPEQKGPSASRSSANQAAASQSPR